MSKKKQVKLADSCPTGYFWNGSRCVPNITPPPSEEDKEEVDEDK